MGSTRSPLHSLPPVETDRQTEQVTCEGWLFTPHYRGSAEDKLLSTGLALYLVTPRSKAELLLYACTMVVRPGVPRPPAPVVLSDL